MRDDEMVDAGYSFKFATIHEDEDYVCYLSKHDKSQDVVSKFLESIMGDKFKPSEDYGVSVIHKGSKLDADVEIFGFFTKKFINKVLLHHSKKKDMIHKSLLKTIEPFRETSKKNTIVDVGKKMIYKILQVSNV